MSSKAAKHWEEIFRSTSLLEEIRQRGWIRLRTQDLRERYHAEPRLLKKVDEYESLPDVFRNYGIVPISLTNQEYVLLQIGEGGKPLFPTLPSPKGLPRWQDTRTLTKFLTLPWATGFTNESQALDAAYLSGILSDFVREEELYLTIRGRMRFRHEIPLRFYTEEGIKEFFEEGGKPLTASGFQLEIDAGYESPHFVYLIEAKKRIQKSFNLRQVVFPYHLWNHILRGEKTVRSLFLVYTNPYYFLYEIEITDPSVLNAIRITRSAWYALGTPPLSLEEVQKLITTLHPKEIPETPFPQADSLLRIYNLLEVLTQRENMTPEEVATEEEFDIRQGHYYLSAAEWLGWIKQAKQEQRILTKIGRQIAKGDTVQRALLTMKSLAQRPVFHESFEWWVKHRNLPPKPKITHWIKQASQQRKIKPLSGATPARRAQTVLAWLRLLYPMVKERP